MSVHPAHVSMAASAQMRSTSTRAPALPGTLVSSAGQLCWAMTAASDRQCALTS
ncbi:hypothetical protein DPMN_051688 [Dreissena polymorpha]|uniref:Uncharacterized protein n=1 Tax=Dreissena polymorpha TaxID=45954 RepID=A0A9D4CJ16_DREPO|nr:hypothetical protein DPMN_051688 [Dreissena polymorpha]